MRCLKKWINLNKINKNYKLNNNNILVSLILKINYLEEKKYIILIYILLKYINKNIQTLNFTNDIKVLLFILGPPPP